MMNVRLATQLLSHSTGCGDENVLCIMCIRVISAYRRTQVCYLSSLSSLLLIYLSSWSGSIWSTGQPIFLPQKYRVPGCRGDYQATTEHDVEKVSVFRFPKDPELRAKWTRLIPWQNLVVNDKTIVCEKHFTPHFIIRVDSTTRLDGSVQNLLLMLTQLFFRTCRHISPLQSSVEYIWFIISYFYVLSWMSDNKVDVITTNFAVYTMDKELYDTLPS